MSSGRDQLEMVRATRDHFYAAEKQRLTQRDNDIPPIPPEAVHYLRMRVSDLSPNEYWETSRYDMEVGMMIQNARNEAITDARETYGEQAKA